LKVLQEQKSRNFNDCRTGNVTTLIPDYSDHPGRGSVLIDDMLSSNAVDVLLRLYNSLPIDMNQRQKKNSAVCSERSYYCDAEGVLQKLLQEGLCRVGFSVSDSNSVLTSTSTTNVRVFPHMRFLNYIRPGSSLPPHVDLCRVDPFCPDAQKRSTHTFILYLSDCISGGETRLLDDLREQGRARATVAPRRGRLLIFPHSTPHEGLEVVDVPKILLRGEIRLSTS
jgi:2OG-Fe(II) oxygenase superfamily